MNRIYEAYRENKPDWGNAPKWADWLAMDSTGVWYWYENKPIWNDDYAIWEAKDGLAREVYGAFDSLEERPNDQPS